MPRLERRAQLRVLPAQPVVALEVEREHDVGAGRNRVVGDRRSALDARGPGAGEQRVLEPASDRFDGRKPLFGRHRPALDDRRPGCLDRGGERGLGMHAARDVDAAAPAAGPLSSSVGAAAIASASAASSAPTTTQSSRTRSLVPAAGRRRYEVLDVEQVKRRNPPLGLQPPDLAQHVEEPQRSVLLARAHDQLDLLVRPVEHALKLRASTRAENRLDVRVGELGAVAGLPAIGTTSAPAAASTSSGTPAPMVPTTTARP